MASNTSSSNKKHLLNPPLVVSTDCSTLRSFYLTCRRHFCHSKLSVPIDFPSKPLEISMRTSSSPSPETPHNQYCSTSATPICLTDGKAAAQAYWRRAHQLEQEIKQLQRWINIEKNLRDCIENFRSTVTKPAKLYHIKVEDKVWGRLAIQVSAPAILPAEPSSRISQVLQRMASMGNHNLSRWLVESMPMQDIHQSQIEEIEMGTVRPGSERGFMEAILLASMEKMEILALEGLRIQMGTRDVTHNHEEVTQENEKTDGGSIFLVVLIQIKDREKEYEEVGNTMVGLIRASVTDEEVESSGFSIDGVHVAGIPTGFKDNSGECLRTPLSSVENHEKMRNFGRERGERSESNYLWSMSVRYCEGKCNCRCWNCVMNPDIKIDLIRDN